MNIGESCIKQIIQSSVIVYIQQFLITTNIF